MSLTSYRAAPPRVNCVGVMAGRAARSLGFVRPGSFCFCGRRGAACPLVCLQAVCLRCFCHDKGPLVAARWTAFDGLLRDEKLICVLQTWQRPTLPRLETKYHRRWGVSRPCSERERVQPPRNNHQVGETHIKSRSCSFVFRHAAFEALLRKADRPTFGRPVRSEAAKPRRRQDSQDEHWQMRTIKPIELLVPVSFTHCCASTPGLSTWSSSTALIGNTRFQVGFPLRCLQRLSRPYIATLQCGWRHNRSTRGTSIPVLSY